MNLRLSPRTVIGIFLFYWFYVIYNQIQHSILIETGDTYNVRTIQNPKEQKHAFLLKKKTLQKNNYLWLIRRAYFNDVFYINKIIKIYALLNNIL